VLKLNWFSGIALFSSPGLGGTYYGTKKIRECLYNREVDRVRGVERQVIFAGIK
jgi:hypothetical protein